MISRRQRVACCAALVLVCAPRSARAQPTGSVDLSAAYVYLRDPTVDVSFAAGWNVGASLRIHEWLSVAAEIDDSRKTMSTVAGDLSLGVRAFMAGARASAKLGRAVEFGQVLLGAARASGTAFGVTEAHTHPSAQIGAGIDYPLHRGVALRVELDYRVVLGDRFSVLDRQVRALTGVVVRVF